MIILAVVINTNGTNDILLAETSSNSPYIVIILDGMAVVNALPKDSKDSVSAISTC